jgi:putative heme transporter
MPERDVVNELRSPVGSGEPLSPASPPALHDVEEMPRVHLTRRNMVVFALFVVSAVAFLYFVLPKLAGLGETWERVRDGAHGWIAAAVGLEVLAFASYVTLFRTVFVRGSSRIDWRESVQINMSALAATRLFNTAGAGGIALTAWALRRSGMERRIVACRMVAFLVLLYAVYMGALLIDGLFLRIGLFEGSAPFALTVVPAALAGVFIALVLALSLLPEDFARLARSGFTSPRLAKWAQAVATAPATLASGTRTAIEIMRAGNLGILGAVGWWGFDIAVLWASFHAFGEAPPQAVIVMGYFVGMTGNVLPLPGGVGGVDGGMIGAFIAFGVDSGLAVVAVLVYRAIAFWLPTIPGVIAYLRLRKTVHRWGEEPAPA